MNLSALHHLPLMEYREALPDGRVRIRLRTAREDLDKATLLHVCIYKDARFRYRFNKTPMTKVASGALHDWYQADFTPDDPRQCYLFELQKNGQTCYLDQEGIKEPEAFGEPPFGINPFAFAYVYPPRPLPAWALGKVGYQIFPDRFRRQGPPGPGIQPWDGGEVKNHRYFGGNLQGIREAIPYLKELGVSLVYLTPIFKAHTAHRYDTADYYQIDPMLGTLQDLKDLVTALHQNNMRLILDGVFNHSGTRFAPFVDAREKGPASPYYDWFFFDDSTTGYQTFAFTAMMPKINLDHEAAARYFLEVGRYWLRETGMDGWRLDVSPEVSPDFWRRFRREIHRENPEALLIAECWDDSREWVNSRDMFDGTMNYLLSRAIWRFFALRETSLAAFDSAVHHALSLYPTALLPAQWSFLSSHDTPRLLTRADGDIHRQRLAVFFQFTCPGLPVIYYGDELGMAGEGDPDCRRPMAWDQVGDNSTLAFYRQLAGLRNRLPALQTGAFTTLEAGEDGLYAYLRGEGEEAVLCVLYTGPYAGARPLRLPGDWAAADSLHDAWTGQRCPVADGSISLPAAPGACFLFTQVDPDNP